MQCSMNTALKELFAILVAVHTWGSHCTKQKKNLFYCNNQSVIDMRKKRLYSWPQNNGSGMAFVFCAAQHSINVCVIHIPGSKNNSADAIFHFQMAKFRQLAPMAHPTPDRIPAWPMESFTNAFCTATFMALPPPPDVQVYITIQHHKIPELLQSVLHLTITSIIINPSVFLCLQTLNCILQDLEVYYTGIRILHIEKGFTDPTMDPLLQLVCRNIFCMLGDRSCKSYQITYHSTH